MFLGPCVETYKCEESLEVIRIVARTFLKHTRKRAVFPVERQAYPSLGSGVIREVVGHTNDIVPSLSPTHPLLRPRKGREAWGKEGVCVSINAFVVGPKSLFPSISLVIRMCYWC